MIFLLPKNKFRRFYTNLDQESLKKVVTINCCKNMQQNGNKYGVYCFLSINFNYTIILNLYQKITKSNQLLYKKIAVILLR